MSTVTPLTANDCPLPPPFEAEIAELQKASNEQDKTDAKSRLTALKKLSDEVQQIEAKYAKEYEALEFAETQLAEFQKTLSARVGAKLSPTVKDKIKKFVECAPDLSELEKQWKDARNLIPDRQRDLARAQNELADATDSYKEAANFTASQKNLDELKTQGSKEFEAQNYRAAYFLVALDMKDELKTPAKPEEFNKNLEEKAHKYNEAAENARKAKIILDQVTAEAQTKKKAYEDAKSNRRKNILKQIAEEPFTEPAAATTGAAMGAEDDANADAATPDRKPYSDDTTSRTAG